MKRIRPTLLAAFGLLMLATAVQAAGLARPAAFPVPTMNRVENKTFQAGEKLVYRVHYGVVTAGEAIFSVDPTLYTHGGKQCYRISGTGRTASAFEWFYKVRDEFYTFVDTKEMKPHRYRRITREGDYRFDDEVTFDYNKKKISGVRGTFDMKNNTQDMVSALYYARCLDLRNAAVGTVFDIPTFIDDKIFDLGMKVKGRETIQTPLGKFRCIKVTPIVVDGRVFKGKEEMTIWITDDDNLVPVQIETPIVVGAIKCTITKMENLRHPIGCKVG